MIEVEKGVLRARTWWTDVVEDGGTWLECGVVMVLLGSWGEGALMGQLDQMTSRQS